MGQLSWIRLGTLVSYALRRALCDNSILLGICSDVLVYRPLGEAQDLLPGP
jgi:hypothetical protein